jgi:hypothetical protein
MASSSNGALANGFTARHVCLTLIREAFGQGVGVAEFLGSYHGRMSAADRDEALAELAAEGLIERCEPGKTGKGRKPVCYRLRSEAERKAVAR